MLFYFAFSPNYVSVGDVGHVFEFHQSDHPRFGFRGHFECNAVRSLVPESLCDLFMWNPFLFLHFFRLG